MTVDDTSDGKQKQSSTMMVIFPILGGGMIGGFAISRFLSGDYALGAFDLFISISFFALSIYTYITGRDRISRFVSAVLSVIGPLVVLSLYETGGIYWVYSSSVVLFHLVSYRWAIALNIVMLVGVAIFYSSLEFGSVQLYSFLATITLINVFSLLFALNEEKSKARLHELTVRDELSGIENRRAFVEKVEDLINIRKRFGRLACLVYIDIDDFKSVNDTMGHAAGDQAIQRLARFITSMLRETDSVYRIGGDEFVIITEGGDEDMALQLTEKVRLAVSQKEIIANRKLTISMGVALLNDMDTADSWLARADTELYKAKQKSRLQVRASIK
jgi:diguanylate cyclase (GGDEF)-like protein